jgi:hypothetical protein
MERSGSTARDEALCKMLKKPGELDVCFFALASCLFQSKVPKNIVGDRHLVEPNTKPCQSQALSHLSDVAPFPRGTFECKPVKTSAIMMSLLYTNSSRTSPSFAGSERMEMKPENHPFCLRNKICAPPEPSPNQREAETRFLSCT